MAFTPTYAQVGPRATMAGQGYGVMVDITMDAVSAYPAGGFSISGACGIFTITGAIPAGNSTAAVGLIPQYDTSNSKLQVFTSVATNAVALNEFSGTFSATTVFRMFVIGY